MTTYYQRVLERVLSGDGESVEGFMAFCDIKTAHWYPESHGCKVVLHRKDEDSFLRTPIMVDLGSYGEYRKIIRISAGMGLRESYFTFDIEDPKEKVFFQFQEHFKLVTDLDPHLFQ